MLNRLYKSKFQQDKFRIESKILFLTYFTVMHPEEICRLIKIKIRSLNHRKNELFKVLEIYYGSGLTKTFQGHTQITKKFSLSI